MHNLFGYTTKTTESNIPDNDKNVDYLTLDNLRQDIMGELAAINQYTEHINMTNNPTLKATWEDIRAEEQVHVGQLMNMLFYLDPSSYENFNKGVMESNKLKSN